MAFDMKRLRTFDWLYDLAHNKAAYSSNFPKFAYMLGSVDTRVYIDAIKPFKINRISPVVYTSENKLFLMGHNKDVSIRVVAMCMKGV